jgi:hypothetical protein
MIFLSFDLKEEALIKWATAAVRIKCGIEFSGLDLDKVPRQRLGRL